MCPFGFPAVKLTPLPRLFSPEFGDQPYITNEAAEVLNDGTDTLNRVSRKTAGEFFGVGYPHFSKESYGQGVGSPTR